MWREKRGIDFRLCGELWITDHKILNYERRILHILISFPHWETNKLTEKTTMADCLKWTRSRSVEGGYASSMACHCACYYAISPSPLRHCYVNSSSMRCKPIQLSSAAGSSRVSYSTFISEVCFYNSIIGFVYIISWYCGILRIQNGGFFSLFIYSAYLHFD